MATKFALWLAPVGIVCALAAPVEAALLHRWLLDDNPTDVGDTLVDSAGNRDMTVQGGFFGADVKGTTGYDGVANSAVQFHDYNATRKSYADFRYSTDPNDPNDPFTIVEPANFNGGVLGHLGDWTVDYWLRMDQSPNKQQTFAEPIISPSGSSGGPVVGAQFNPGTGDLWFALIHTGDHDDTNILPGAGDPQVQPPGGFETGKWYYLAHVYQPAVVERDANGVPIWDGGRVGFPANTIQNGAEHLYVWDGTNLVSETTVTDGILTYGWHSGWKINRFRLAGNYVEGSYEMSAMDDFSIYDQAFDPNSFLVHTLGVPEPASLAVLGLGALLLARRRRAVVVS